MLTVDSGCLFQVPDESGYRVLQPAQIVGCSNDVYTAKAEATRVHIEKNTEILVFYEIKNVFSRQTAYIVNVDREEGCPVFEFQTRGKPVSVETRQEYRVSAVMAGLTAKLGNQADCELLDVSCSGFSVISATKHDIGRVLDATLWQDGQTYEGKAVVQSVRELSPGCTRYGLYCDVDKRTQSQILKGLNALTIGLQRDQLRRMAASR